MYARFQQMLVRNLSSVPGARYFLSPDESYESRLANFKGQAYPIHHASIYAADLQMYYLVLRDFSLRHALADHWRKSDDNHFCPLDYVNTHQSIPHLALAIKFGADPFATHRHLNDNYAYSRVIHTTLVSKSYLALGVILYLTKRFDYKTVIEGGLAAEQWLVQNNIDMRNFIIARLDELISDARSLGTAEQELQFGPDARVYLHAKDIFVTLAERCFYYANEDKKKMESSTIIGPFGYGALSQEYKDKYFAEIDAVYQGEAAELYTRALACLQKAYQLDPDNSDLHNNILALCEAAISNCPNAMLAKIQLQPLMQAQQHLHLQYSLPRRCSSSVSSDSQQPPVIVH
tara:strand:+ start:462 stop:1502 length:1041 start_codon:yes stop_codon:yes gene_type:complete